MTLSSTPMLVSHSVDLLLSSMFNDYDVMRSIRSGSVLTPMQPTIYRHVNIVEVPDSKVSIFSFQYSDDPKPVC